MTYWFVQSPVETLHAKSLQSLKFTYSQTQHEKTAKKLNQLLTKLTDWLQLYEQKEQFPQVAEGSKHCEYCQFVTRCDRDRYDGEEALSQNWLPNLADIQEVSL